jgi:hypothetical protein
MHSGSRYLNQRFSTCLPQQTKLRFLEVHRAKTCFGLASNTVRSFVLRSSEVYDKLQEKKCSLGVPQAKKKSLHKLKKIFKYC